MKRALLIGAIAAVFASAGIAAQGRNFAGTWTIDSEKTIAENGGAGGGGRGGAVGVRSGGGGGATVATGGAVAAGGGGRGGGGMRGGGGAAGAPGMVLTVDANTFTIAQGTSTTAYKTDGSVTNLDNEMRKASAKAAWQGDKLVIATTTEGPNGTVTTQATWYIEGEWLVRENKSTGPDGQDVVRKTFYKKAA